MDGTQTVNGSTIGTASYSPLQGWSNTKKYAFFAFYPMPNENVTLVYLNPDGTTSPYTRGVPAIKYTNPNLDVTKMEDVMTANYYTDLFWHSSNDGGNNIPSGEVNFTFDHKLSCFEVRVKESSAAAINIIDFRIALSGILYEGIVIPLNGDDSELIKAQKATHEIALPLTDNEKALGQEYKNLCDLLLIPQGDNISISLNVNYTRKYGNNDPVSFNFQTIEPLTTALVRGTKHLVQLDFGDKNVYVMQNNSGWTEKTVEHKFN